METININKKDFEMVYEKLLHQYKIENLSLIEMSEIALIAESIGYSTNFNFELSNTNLIENCDCSKHNKLFSKKNIVCMNCNKVLSMKLNFK